MLTPLAFSPHTNAHTVRSISNHLLAWRQGVPDRLCAKGGR